jgi:hypothetical protein
MVYRDKHVFNQEDTRYLLSDAGRKPRLLDLFCGRWGWSRAFAARGWQCFGVDLTVPPEIPDNCTFFQENVLDLSWEFVRRIPGFDFICASSPCEQFSVHGMKHFHLNPKYPELGIKLFNHTRELCEASGVPYVMENVRAAQQFVGNAAHHCGPFYLWGNAVPPLVTQGVRKMMRGNGTAFKQFAHLPLEERRRARNEHQRQYPLNKRESASLVAEIPPELANCVADYAERLLEQRAVAK